MRQEPYEKPGSDCQGELKDDWARRVDYCQKEARLPDDPTARWQMFMTPFYMTSGANRCRKCLFESFVLIDWPRWHLKN